MRIVKEFLKLESASGLLLIIATIVAIITANSYFSNVYDNFITTNIAIIIGKFEIKKPILLWINDGLMAIFFFLIGLELKREVLKGHLSKMNMVILPSLGAIGGIVGPAIIFYLFNKNNMSALNGWAIPTATDIAFSLGILSLTSKKVPSWAKIFLLTLAIFDDLIAIIIIALFYTDNISVNALIFAAAIIIIFFIFKKTKIQSTTPYVLMGIILWVCVLKSGIHATLAGFTTALFIPTNNNTKKLEHDIHPWIAFGILPIFAFTNTGINLSMMNSDILLHSITIGIALGLFIGKPIGISIFCFAPLLLRKIKMPKGASYLSLFGISALAGAGFTMSLFISVLAYGDMNLNHLLKARSGVLIGSIMSCALGYIILRKCFSMHQK